MRLSARNVTYVVDTVPDSTGRPVRLAIAGSTYRMDAAEAIDLATQLADAVTRLNSTRSTP